MKKFSLFLLILIVVLSLTACGHQHTWVEATCTEAKICDECGETEGEPLGHDWQAATYTQPKTCARCGETEGKPLTKPAEPTSNTGNAYQELMETANAFNISQQRAFDYIDSYGR